jgi:Kef-type K+ transport system membrane component KefB
MSRKEDDYGREYEFQEIHEERKHGSLTGGLLLITVGIIFMIVTFIPSIRVWDLWPILFLVVVISISTTFIVNKIIKNRRK